MNLKIFAIRHWKAIILALQIGLVVLLLATGKAHADPIDSPVGPRI